MLCRRKDGEPYEIDENDPRVTLSKNNMTLAFSVLKPEDSGRYECFAENRIAPDSRSVEIVITSESLE
jgi:hypothetical protein